MTTDLDLRTGSRAERRERLFERLDAASAGESITLVTDRDADVFCHRYRVERGCRLDWQATEEATEARELRVTKGERLDETTPVEFDVRKVPPRRRHEALVETFDALDPGRGFVLVNDHDPKPLYYELRSTRGETFDWEYAKETPGEWRVELVKTEAAVPTDGDAVATFDVREIPSGERHETIHHRYGTIPPGATLELVAPHEPRPLYREFRQRYGESFAWDVVEDEPGRCRVRITKETDGDDAEPDADAEADGDAEAGDEFRWEYRLRDPGEFRVLVGKARAGDAGASAHGSSGTPF